MNHYGAQALKHWQTYLPQRYATLTDPNSFFSTLGDQAASQIADLTQQLAGPDLPDEGYLGKVGRLTAAKQQAEEIVLPELILIDPQTDDRTPEQLLTAAAAAAPASPLTPPAGWVPLVEDPTDPRWQQIAEEEAAMADDEDDAPNR